MDFLKAQFLRIQEQLAGLTATQKMLVVSLLTIMVMTLLWWSHWAAQPEMSPLLDQTMTAEDIGQISTNLDAQGIPHEVVGDKVYVPADRKMEIMAVLGYSQALPKSFDTGFDAIIKQMNWLDPPDKSKEMFQHAKNQALSELIRRFPGVADAAVVIDPSTEFHIGEDNVQPVATVTMTTGRNNGTSPRQLAESAADVVSGAQAGLLRDHIHVVIDGAPFVIKDRTGDGMSDGGSDVDVQRQYEDYYREKIEQALQDIRGVMVSVTVKVDSSHSTKTIHTVDPKQTVSVPTRSEDTTDDQNAQQAANQEPGAVPNATNQPLDLNAGGGGGGGSNSSTEKNEFDADYGHQEETINQGAGSATVQTASVRVPRSYFIQAYKNENGGKDPDDPTVLSAYVTKVMGEIHDEVKGCAVFPTDDALFVGVYSDTPQAELPVGDTGAASSLTTTLGRNTKEIAVSVLAVMSLFMVMMMVRKGGSSGGGGGGGVTEPIEEEEVQNLKGSETVVGNASENSASLDGMELDAETVKAQQMMDQVQQMVQSNPDAAASLVKKWMAR